jgi:hypothetical protein
MRTARAVTVTSLVTGGGYMISGTAGMGVLALGLILIFIVLMVGMASDQAADRLGMLLSVIWGRKWWEKKSSGS